MTNGVLRGIACAAFICAAAPVLAQEAAQRVAVHGDWSVFKAADPDQQCWTVSGPSETVNTRNGQVVAVRRGETLMFVTYIPDSNVNGQVSFTGGYPFRDGSNVTVDVKGTTFEFFTKDETAWAATDAEDARVVAAMKAGATAVVTGVSSRGTRTKDTFSLIGFTAAIEEAKERCSG